MKYRSAGGAGDSKWTKEKKYEVAAVSADVDAVSYLGSSGYTLTVMLDYKTKKLVAFASNEKSLLLQHGSFEHVKSTSGRESRTVKQK